MFDIFASQKRSPEVPKEAASENLSMLEKFRLVFVFKFFVLNLSIRYETYMSTSVCPSHGTHLCIKVTANTKSNKLEKGHINFPFLVGGLGELV